MSLLFVTSFLLVACSGPIGAATPSSGSSGGGGVSHPPQSTPSPTTVQNASPVPAPATSVTATSRSLLSTSAPTEASYVKPAYGTIIFTQRIVTVYTVALLQSNNTSGIEKGQPNVLCNLPANSALEIIGTPEPTYSYVRFTLPKTATEKEKSDCTTNVGYVTLNTAFVGANTPMPSTATPAPTPTPVPLNSFVLQVLENNNLKISWQGTTGRFVDIKVNADKTFAMLVPTQDGARWYVILEYPIKCGVYTIPVEIFQPGVPSRLENPQVNLPCAATLRP